MDLSGIRAASKNVINTNLKCISHAIKEKELEIQKCKAALKYESETSDKFESSDWTKTYKKWNKIQHIENIKTDLGKNQKKLEMMKQKKNRHHVPCCGSHNRKDERKVAEMPLEEKLKEMRRFRGEGNTFYGERKYSQAMILYEKSLIYFEYCLPRNTLDEAKVDQERVHCLVNSAACFLNLGNFTKCIEYCTMALDVDKNVIKAWFRRARAYREVGDYDKALADLKSAQQLDVEGTYKTSISQESSRHQNHVTKYKRETKKMAEAMWMEKDGNKENEKEEKTLSQ